MSWWLTLLVLAGCLVFLALVLVLVGLFCPEKYQAQVRMRLARSPEMVWIALLDYKKFPLTGALSKQVEQLPDENGQLAWLDDLGSTQIKVTTLAATSPMRLKRQLTDQKVPMTAVFEVQLERIEGGCLITATNETIIRWGTWHVPLFRFVMTVTRGADKVTRAYLRRLAMAFNEPAQFE